VRAKCRERKRGRDGKRYQTGVEGVGSGELRGSALALIGNALAPPLRIVDGSDHVRQLPRVIQGVDVEQRRLDELVGVDGIETLPGTIGRSVEFQACLIHSSGVIGEIIGGLHLIPQMVFALQQS